MPHRQPAKSSLKTTDQRRTETCATPQYTACAKRTSNAPVATVGVVIIILPRVNNAPYYQIHISHEPPLPPPFMPRTQASRMDDQTPLSHNRTIQAFKQTQNTEHRSWNTYLQHLPPPAIPQTSILRASHRAYVSSILIHLPPRSHTDFRYSCRKRRSITRSCGPVIT